MERPWNNETETSDESPLEEYGRFEDWIKSLLPDDESREYYDMTKTEKQKKRVGNRLDGLVRRKLSAHKVQRNNYPRRSRRGRR